MRFLRTDFGKVHAATAAFALVNVLLALALKAGLMRGGLYPIAVTVHVVAGFLILPTLLLLPLAFPTHTKIYRAMRAKLLLNRRDLAQKNAPVIAAKTVTMLMALGFVSQTVTALLLRTGLAYRWFPTLDVYAFHTAFVFVLPVLVLLHPILMLLAHRRKAAKGK